MFFSLKTLLPFSILLSFVSVLQCSSIQSSYVDSSSVISGFLKVGSLSVRVHQRINAPSICRSVQFINIPVNTTSPLMNGATFNLITDKHYNDRSAWTNGADYLFFINPTSDTPYGTWLVSAEPGEDNGYAYLKPSHETLVPVGADTEWYWLERRGWSFSPEIKLQCIDTVTLGTHFYVIEYFENNEVYTSFYSPPIFLPDLDHAPLVLNDYESLSSRLFPSLFKNSFWNVKEKKWKILEDAHQVICKLGGAVMITDPQG